ncbi:MAG: purine-cytosine permease family protein [Nitrososphaerales archaeon]
MTRSTTQDKATEIERFGIDHIPEDKRHGSPGRIFTIWFAANLTIADYVIGVLCIQIFGLTLYQTVPVLIVGNVLGGLLVGLSAAMGPTLGFPQLFSSRNSFGRKGNYVPGGLNWVSTVGWFTVNTILGAEALQVILPSFSFYLAAVILVAAQVLIGIYGHDFIHLFEKWMSVVLGLIWLGVFIIAIPHLTEAVSYVPPGGSASTPLLSDLGIALAVSFSYIMSWSPYASDYSRYLPFASSKRKITLFALAGGAIASFAIEVVGAIVEASTQSSSTQYFSVLNTFAGSLGMIALIGIILGAIAANALNIYTNSLSALVLDIKTKRWVTVIVGGVVGLALALAGGANFAQNFQNFLLILDYWITPWLAIILVDFFILKRATVESLKQVKGWDFGTLGIYGLAILISVPFMSPALPLGPIVGAIANPYLGGADFSYYISFVIAGVLYYAYRRRSRNFGTLR